MRKVLILLFSFPLLIFSQEYYNDFGTWTKSIVNYSINKKISLTNKTEIRSNSNSLEIDQFYSQFSVSYKMNKHFSNSLAWRIRSINDNYNYQLKNRAHYDLNYKNKFKSLSIYLRSRSQFNFENNNLNSIYERLRGKLKYKINKKFKIYCYNEFYLLLNNSSVSSKLNKNRIGAGIVHRLNKKTDFELKYIQIRELNTENPERMNVLGAAISIDIN